VSHWRCLIGGHWKGRQRAGVLSEKRGKRKKGIRTSWSSSRDAPRVLTGVPVPSLGVRPTRRPLDVTHHVLLVGCTDRLDWSVRRYCCTTVRRIANGPCIQLYIPRVKNLMNLAPGKLRIVQTLL